MQAARYGLQAWLDTGEVERLDSALKQAGSAQTPLNSDGHTVLHVAAAQGRMQVS